jgi:glycosyltransferase involved in cell wall biosynthesis
VEIMRDADFVIVHDSYVLPLVQGSTKGRNPHVFLMLGAADPREHRPLALSAEDRDAYGPNIAFVGGASPYRVSALSRLGALGLRIWGRPEAWRHAPQLLDCVSDEPVYGLKKSKIYGAAKVVLSLEDPEKQLNALNSRVPETLACGGFVLCNWSRDLEDAGFRDGVTVAWFRSLDEMAEKAEFYLREPELRREISARGRELVLRELTWERLAGDLAQRMQAVRQAQVGEKNRAN